MPFRPTAVANYLLDIAADALSPISPMKLQKLVYFSHGWHLAVLDAPLIDESVEAWRWGPVVPSLWGVLKEYGNRAIDKKITVPEPVEGEPFTFQFVEPSIRLSASEASEKESAKAVAERIWQRYGALTAVQLSNMTHEPGTPWYQVWMPMAANPEPRKKIPNDLIREYFRGQLQRQAHA